MDNTVERNMEERFNDVTSSQCPGGPDDGCCEFCPGPCETLMLDKTPLTDDETSKYETLRYKLVESEYYFQYC